MRRRTTIEIDEAFLVAVRAALGSSTMRDTVKEALRQAAYDVLAVELRQAFPRAEAPPDVFDRALALQRDLAHRHGLWHRTAIPDLLVAETALHHELGVLHVDRHYDRIAEVRPLTVRRLR